MRSKLGILVVWLLPVLVFVFAGLISIISPALVDGWKSQGLKEAPFLWQIAIDFASFINLRWFLWLPLYIFVAVFITVMSRRRARA